MKILKTASLSAFVLVTLPIISVYASGKIIVTDLGPHPILMLLLSSIIGGILWFIGYNLHGNIDSGCFSEILGHIMGYLGGALCIGSLISIPINLLFMGYWWVLLLLVIAFFIIVYKLGS